MQLRHSFRVVTAAAVVASLSLVGCGRAGMVGAPVGMAADGEFDAFSKPVNVPAVAAAKAWQPDAAQVGTMVNRSPKGVQDQATYVFCSSRDKDHLLLVIAVAGGLQSQLVNISDRTGDSIKGLLPLTQRQTLDSKKIFKQAEHFGLAGAEDAIILNARGDNGAVPVALVLDGEGKRYMVVDAISGEALTAVQTAGVRHVQFLPLIVAAVVGVGAAVAFGVAAWRKHHDPKPAPIVGNPKTDDTMRQLANAAAYPYRYNEKTSLQAFLAINKANDLYLNGKYDEAATAYKQAIATTFHDSEQAYFELGQCLMAQGDVTNARFAFMQALNINNNYGAAAEALDAINRPTGRG